MFSLVLAGISPSGLLPVLEFDGKVLAESKAILSYVAKEFSKYPPEQEFILKQSSTHLVLLLLWLLLLSCLFICFLLVSRFRSYFKF